ncbi:uncharacterized protein METZ01_LOCUS315803 [marine metagenome]|uniref:Type II secretion system protein GspI C-terminal domain-containing protein n=1 Tax=marine metagenome TaxID=408172 RepID=A0A382NP22_9ZZZZ
MKSIKGLTIIESLVCLVIIGIGFIAVNQLITFAIASMDRSLERNKVNFLSEMVIEDMIGDSNNSSNYAFNEKCKHTSKSSSDLSGAQKNKWRNKFSAANQIKLDGKDRKPRCLTGDEKRAYGTATTGRFIFKTSKGTRIKYLGVGLK